MDNISENDLSSLGKDSLNDKLVFPLNIYDYINVSSGLKPADKKSLVMSAWIFASAIILWFLLNVTRNVTNHYWILSIVILIIIEVLVGSLILSYVFDLESLSREMNKSELSFAQYFASSKALKADAKVGQKYDMFEFKDGSVAIYIQCTMGYNTTQRSQSGCNLTASIGAIFAKAGLKYRRIISNENFKNSLAAKQLLDSVKNVNDSQLFAQYRNIIQHQLNITAEKANVPVTTYIVYAKNRIQRDQIEPAVTRALQLASEEETCYREVRVLACQEIIDYYQDYTKLKVIDMGLVRAKTADSKVSRNHLRILKIYGDKAVYSTPDFANLQDSLLREKGLPEIRS